MKKTLMISVLALICAASVSKAGELTKFATSTGGLDSVVLFPAARTAQRIQSLYAIGNDSSSNIFYYAVGGAGRRVVTAAPTNAATVIAISNTGLAFTTNDMVIYSHVLTGTQDYTTISAATASNVTLAAGITEVGSVVDVLYELTLQGNTVLTGTQFTWTGPNPLFAAPPDSPIRLVAGTSTNANIQATVEW